MILVVWENVKLVWEVIFSEMWECFNIIYNVLFECECVVKCFGLYEFLLFIEGCVVMFVGLVDLMFLCDDGYCFMLFGCVIEWVDMMVWLLLLWVGDSVLLLVWVMLLCLVGVYDMYLCIYCGVLDVGWVVEFMMFDWFFLCLVFYLLKLVEYNFVELMYNLYSWIGVIIEV